MEPLNTPDKNMLKIPNIFNKKKVLTTESPISTSFPPKVVGTPADKQTGFLTAPGQMIKRSVTDLNELSHTSAVKISSSYDLNSDDEKNYNVEIKEFESSKDNKLVKCMVYISCKNAGIIKKMLQEQVIKHNNVHKEKISKLEKVEKCINENMMDLNSEVNILNKELNKMKSNLDEKRNKLRVESITPTEKIKAYINLKGIHDKFEANIVKIHPKNASFDIEYVDEKGKSKSFTGLFFNQLCIVDDKNIHEKATSCDLKGGAKKSKKNMSGGSMEDSMSTDSLC